VLRGNDPAVVNGQLARGQRVFCSDRGQRGGCGKTFPLFFAGTLPRHTFTATLLWALLVKLLGGTTIKAATETLRLPFSLEAIYGILRRLRYRLDVVRVFCAASARHQSAREPIRCCKHLNTCNRSFLRPPALSWATNDIFNSRLWAEGHFRTLVNTPSSCAGSLISAKLSPQPYHGV
jgi:hypothetical protein